MVESRGDQKGCPPDGLWRIRFKADVKPSEFKLVENWVLSSRLAHARWRATHLQCDDVIKPGGARAAPPSPGPRSRLLINS
jgi:hypothetical protein